MNNYFRENLKFIRENKRMSQNRFADYLGINQSNILRWEDGTRTPGIDAVIDISEKLNIPLDVLIGVDLKYENQKHEIKDKYGDKLLTIPRDCGKWKQGEIVSVNEFMEYIDELKTINDKLASIESILKGE